MTWHLPLPLRLLGACLVLAFVFDGGASSQAQTPAPERVSDAPAEAAEANAPVATEGGTTDAGESDPEAAAAPDGAPTSSEAGAAGDRGPRVESPPNAVGGARAAGTPALAASFVDAGVPSDAAPDAGPDAGPEDAGTTAPAAAPIDAGVLHDAGELTAPPVAPPASSTTFVQLPTVFTPAVETSDPWAGLRKIIPGIPTGGIGPLGLLTLLALLALLSATIERLRVRLLRDGWLPTLLSFTQVCARLLALLVALALVIQVVPADVRWVVYFILMASGAALGWSMRDVMPDLIAGIVIVFERRIRRGVWIRSEEFSGAVERLGLRSTWLRDSKGHRVAIPNRMLMQIPIVSDEEGDTVQEVVLRVGSKANATDIRRALRDAVLASPWTTPNCEPQVLRDPIDPELWQVRGRLLSASFASAFQGQLLERAEAHLTALESRAIRVRELVPGEEGTNTGPATMKHPKLDKGEKPDKQGEKTEKTPKTP